MAFDYPTHEAVPVSALLVFNLPVFFHPRLTGPGEQARTGSSEQAVLKMCNISGWCN